MINESQRFERVKFILEDKLGYDKNEITLESNITTDLGADSLDKVELIMEIEKEFDLRIDDEKAENVETVGDIIKLLQELGR